MNMKFKMYLFVNRIFNFYWKKLKIMVYCKVYFSTSQNNFD